jgi:hypothetical protein
MIISCELYPREVWCRRQVGEIELVTVAAVAVIAPYDLYTLKYDNDNY